MKKITSLLLSALLITSTVPIAGAVDSDMSAKAEAVTRKVKQTLQISDEYTDFHSEYEQNEDVPVWLLYWSNEDESKLSVRATEQGKILYYYNSAMYSRDSNSVGFAPSMPKASSEAVTQSAEKFLARVLTSDESVRLEDAQLSRSGNETYLDFDILLNGLPSPLNGSIRLEGNEVWYFWRTDSSSYQGGVPSAAPKVQAAEGQSALYGAVKLQLEYTTSPDSSDKKQPKAALQYVPVDKDEWVVDAQTGKLLNLTQLYNESFAQDNAFRSSGSGDAKAPMASAKDEGSSISPVELDGLDKLKNILSAQELDSRLRAMPELALTGFQLAETSYSYDKEKDFYTCSLSYNRKDGESYDYKFIIADAQTGTLQHLNAFGNQETEVLDAEASQPKAQAFLQKYFPGQAEQTAPYEGSSIYANQGVLLARQHQSIFYPDNYYRLTFDKDSGNLVSFRSNWDEDVQFDSLENIVDAEAALTAWQNARPIVLGYAAAAETRQDRYQERLILAYQYSSKANRVYGVDAKTGEALLSTSWDKEDIIYTDVSSDDEEILALAQLGIGYKSGEFEKSKPLTQVDMLAFLISADDGYYDLDDEDSLDNLYNRAYNLGILKRGERNETAAVSRIALIKAILDMSGYGVSARIPGIFVCSFTDAASISTEYYGYAAIAQGLGMVKGSENGRLMADKIATREQMAIIFYNFMNRSVQ